MTCIEEVIKKFINFIDGKDVLEVGCGSADFSINSAAIAKNVHCIDLTDKWLSSDINKLHNAEFLKMDAAQMQFETCSFDTVVWYNAAGHLETGAEKILKESLRVMKENGIILIIGSWKIDKIAIKQTIIPLLQTMKVNFTVDEFKNFISVSITA